MKKLLIITALLLIGCHDDLDNLTPNQRQVYNDINSQCIHFGMMDHQCVMTYMATIGFITGQAKYMENQISIIRDGNGCYMLKRDNTRKFSNNSPSTVNVPLCLNEWSPISH